MPAPTARRTAPALSRRAAVAGLVATLVGAAGCDSDRSGRGAGPGVSRGPGTTSANPDVALVDRVGAEVAELEALVGALTTRFDALQARLRPWGDLHRAHLAALDTPASAPPVPEPDLTGLHSPAAALRELVRRERLGHAHLLDAAVAARSGTLARLLASMAAAVAQRLAVTGEAREAGPA